MLTQRASRFCRIPEGEAALKILALSDIHGAFETMRKIIKGEPTADVIILAGDLTTRGTADDLKEVLNKAIASSRPVLSILGNMDPPELQPALTISGTSLEDEPVEIGEVGFIGVSSSPFSPLHTPNEVADDELGARAERGWSRLKNPRWKVMIAHTPPLGTVTDRVHSGVHVGSPSLRRFIERCQPDVVVCGHIHEARGIDRIGTSQIVNCGPAFEGSYALIEVAQQATVRLIP